MVAARKAVISPPGIFTSATDGGHKRLDQLPSR
jgi:hypothetical protein